MPLDHKPRKRFGQNFLHDKNIISRILKLIQPADDKHIVEIGPGLGALTYPLSEMPFRFLDLIEIDRDLVERLDAHFQTTDNVSITSVDALSFDFSLLLEKDQDSKGLSVIGNLPYNISTPLLFHLFDQKELVNEMVFMLQKEVVDRLAAAPGSKTYGRLSVMAQWHCEVSKAFKVPPGAFNPPPKVDSAIVVLKPRKAPPFPLQSEANLSLVVQQAFGQRRKTLRNTLKSYLTPDQMLDCGIDPGLRPDQLSLEDFVLLANLLPA